MVSRFVDCSVSPRSKRWKAKYSADEVPKESKRSSNEGSRFSAYL